MLKRQKSNSTLIRIALRGDWLKFFLLITLSVLLLVTQKNFKYQPNFSVYLHVILEPVRSVPNILLRWYKNIAQASLFNKGLSDRVEYLEKQNMVLSARVRYLSKFKEQNVGLIKLLSAKALINDFSVRLAETMYVVNSPVLQEISIDLGKDDNISLGQGVINENGVIGQISQIGVLNSKVILISDPSVSITAYNQRNGLRVVIRGSQKSLRLSAPNSDLNILRNDLFLATGLGGIFPKDYPVGTVEKIEANRHLVRASLKPVVKLGALGKVLVLSDK